MWPYRLFLIPCFAALLALAGCASLTPQPHPAASAADDPAAASCCLDVERYPPLIVRIADPVAPLIGRTVGAIVWRKGYLNDDPDAQAEVLRQLRPLDIVLVSNKGRLSNHALPGVFSHAAVYLGTEKQLRRAGVWNDPRIREHRGAIAAGSVFIEADKDGVHLSPAGVVLNVDRLAVVRPQLANTGRRKQALVDYFAALGGRFDFRFDAGTRDCVFCTELVSRVIPELQLRERDAYGRSLIVPDELANAAAGHDPALSFVLYIRGDRKRWERASRAALESDLASYWTK